MPSLAPPSRASRASLAALTSLVALVVSTGACRKSAPPPVGLGPRTEGPLVFPPQQDGWTARAPVPAPSTKRDPKAISLLSPSPDKDGKIEVSGKTVRLRFDDTIVDDLKKAPKLTITPPVASKTVWPYGSAVELEADAPFDPDVTYTVGLPDLTNAEGRTLRGFKVSFRAKLAIEVGGKTLTYEPEKGKPRALATLPLGDGKIGGRQEVHVVFDQPIDLALARSLVSLSETDGTAIPSTVTHLASSTFEGQKVDPRMIVVVRPQTRRKPGETFVVHARSKREDQDPRKTTLTVAEPTTLAKVSCSPACEEGDGGTRVLGNAHADLQFTLSNPASRVLRTENVQVSPPVKNLWVSGWDAKGHISGAFEPSRTYTIRIGGGLDDYGGAVAPTTLTFETRPLPASLTMAEGPLLAGDAVLRAIPVTARNVVRAEARLWALPAGDVATFTKALREARAGVVPTDPPTAVVPFTPASPKDVLEGSTLDLAANVLRGRVYVVQLVPTQLVPKALAAADTNKRGDGGEGDPKTSAVAALLVAAAPGAVGAHVHQVGAKVVVQAFVLETGEPVASAKVTVGSSTVTTDAAGTAVLAADGTAAGDELVARIEANGQVTLAPFGGAQATSAQALFPDLTASRDASAASMDTVGMIVTDRGVYRPGSKVRLKGFVRRLEAGGVKAFPGAKVRLHVVDGTEQQVSDELVTTGERGTFTRDLDLDKDAKTGRWHVKLELDGPSRVVLADEVVRVAAFQAPRFKVDVEPIAGGGGAEPTRAKVTARYLFGGAMGGAKVAWSLRANRIPVKGGALENLGLSFDDDGGYDEEQGGAKTPKPTSGEGKLDDAGTFVIEAAHEAASTRTPTELVLEADVSDASNRHVAGSARTVVHGATHYAGVRLARRFGGRGPLRVDLGVVDTAGNAAPGVKVGARLERLTWTRTAEKAESGALIEQWKDEAKTVGECTVSSEAKPVSCELSAPEDGSYRVVTQLDGRDGPRASYWAWSEGGRAREGVPSAGKKLPLVLDRARYKAGDTAKVLVQSPFAAATALLTIEQGGLLRHEVKRVDGPAATFDVPLAGASTPWVHAVVTLLPIGSSEADYRVGAVRIPVSDEGARLDVTVASAKPSYEVKDEAEITVVVKRGGAPVKNADVTLAIVDEGVLRLTNHHAKDPLSALHPGRDLGFRVFDTRGWLVRRREKAHVAGGGDGGGEDGLDTRRRFVETAAFLTDLVTDASGKVTAKVPLPDNLTEFRMMAVAVDEVGGGGNAEGSFVVTKPILIDPVMPRFALRGDQFEAAAIVHNATATPVLAKVTVAGQTREVSVPAKGQARVGAPFTAKEAGTRTMRFAVETQGKVRDAAEIPLRIDVPGVTEHPAISGVLVDKQEIALAVPEDALFEEGAALSIKTGSALYPELGQRLGYLLDYPHGCVEQTTSSTLPLLAARTLLPWTGVAALPDEELTKRIRAGVERLATMTTSEGGLAYWPGGSEPNTWGTAYALRALVGARALGIERPKLIEGVITYLTAHLTDGDPDTRVFLAESLARARSLPESSADALWDVREKVGTFGKASLAIALGTLPKQEDRVKALLDELEASFDETGAPKQAKAKDDDAWLTWGSADRDRAQTLSALVEHRPTSTLATRLAERLARRIDGYTTQTTAWSLLAMAAYVGGKSPDGGVDVTLRLEGHVLDTTRKLGGDNKEVRVPLRDLAGKRLTLILTGDGKTPSAFALDATWKRALEAQGGRVGRHAPKGASIHRFYTDSKGVPLDLAAVKAGQVVRVALRVQQPKSGDHDLAWIALTDRLPAGFEPIDPDLATVGRIDELGGDHPLGGKGALEGCWTDASHVDLRDDRVQIYYDRVYGSGGRCLFASYLARATTPGTFALPPAHQELMYEPGSDGYSDAARVTVVP